MEKRKFIELKDLTDSPTPTTVPLHIGIESIFIDIRSGRLRKRTPMPSHTCRAIRIGSRILCNKCRQMQTLLIIRLCPTRGWFANTTFIV